MNLNQEEGWALPVLAARRHYFIGGVSLCGRRVLLDAKPSDVKEKNSPDDCVTCTKRLARRQAEEETEKVTSTLDEPGAHP